MLVSLSELSPYTLSDQWIKIQVEKLQKVVKDRLRAVLYVPARTISDLSLPHPQILRRAIEIVQH